MKTIMCVIVALFVGCATPMHSFGPYTTADGNKKWRMIVRGHSEVAIQELIQSEIGRRQMCPDGWKILNRSLEKNFEVINGECK